jgi:two-component system sensor histidine kinase AlgZ
VLRILTKRAPSFWLLQLGGWLIYSVAVAVTSLPFRHERDYVIYRSTFLVSGFFGSFLIYAMCHALWKRKLTLLRSLAICIPFCSLLGLACSTLAVWMESYYGGTHMPFHWATALAGTTGTAFVFLAWSAIYFGIKHYQELEENRRHLIESESLARDAQLRALRYQLQPHFLFNTLNAISTLVLEDRKNQATQMIARLADLLRDTLESPDVHTVSLDEELSMARRYLAIEQVRFAERLRTVFRIAPESLNASVPRLLLQPLVENAIRHGIAPIAGGGELRIESRVEGDQLHMRVSNDCSEGSPARMARLGGLGLANTRDRLRQLYGDQQHLEVDAEQPGRFEVRIQMPLVSSDPATLPDTQSTVLSEP